MLFEDVLVGFPQPLDKLEFVDAVIMRFMDGLLAFPFVLLAIILMTILGSGLQNVILAIGIGNVPTFARVVRGQVHIVKNEEYCNAGRVIGISNARMLTPVTARRQRTV